MASAFVLIGFFLALSVQVAIATRSLRKSWYVSLVYLATSASVVVVLVSERLGELDRRDRLMLALSMPPGAPVQINDMTKLIEVTAEGPDLIYRYEVADNSVLPSQAEAVTQNCQQPDLRAVLELGAAISHRFETRSGSTRHIRVSRSLCD